MSRLPAAWRHGIVAAVVLRVAASVLAALAGGLLPGLAPVDVPASGGFGGWEALDGAEQGAAVLLRGLERFDALWYLAIASDGYPASAGAPPGAAAFFPGYPAVVALVAVVLLGATALAGHLVSLGATVVALAGVHRLAEEVTGDGDTARRAVVVTAVFPSAFFLVAPYSEALFLAATVWALVWARQARWWPAAAAGLLAGATRNVGVLLAVPVLAEAVRQVRWRSRDGLGALAAVAGAPLGLAAYLAYGAARWGTWTAPVDAQTGWQRSFAWPWDVLADAARFAVGSIGVYATGYHALDLVVFLPVAAATVWLLVRGPRSLGLFALAHVGVWLVYPFPSRPLMSTPRFALAVAPVFLAFAVWTRRRAVETVWVAASAALLGVQVVLFAAWYYVF